MTLYQGCSSCHDSSKNKAAKGQGLFSLYSYIKNFKKCSRKKALDWVQCNLAGMLLWWPSTKIVQAFMICQKTWPPAGRGLFSVYICIENFEILLVKYPWPISMLLCWPSTKNVQAILICQKTWLLGVGLIFPIYLDRKLWKSSCQNPLNRFQFNLAGMFVWLPSSKFFFKLSWFFKKKKKKNGR